MTIPTLADYMKEYYTHPSDLVSTLTDGEKSFFKTEDAALGIVNAGAPQPEVPNFPTAGAPQPEPS